MATLVFAETAPDGTGTVGIRQPHCHKRIAEVLEGKIFVNGVLQGQQAA